MARLGRSYSKPFVFRNLVTPTGTVTSLTFSGSITSTGTIFKAAGKIIKAITIVRVGSITPTGTAAVLKFVPRTFTGSITPSGLIVKALTFKRTGSSTPTGAAIKTTALTRIGSTTATGKVIRLTGLIRTGSITAAGLIKKAVSKKLTGSTTPTAGLTILKTGGTHSVMTIAGSITPAGSLVKAISAKRTGSITVSGLISRGYIKRLSGTITTAGLIKRVVSKVFRGQVAPYGLVISPAIGPDDTLVPEPIRTYYPGADQPTRLALFDLDQRLRTVDTQIETIQTDAGATLSQLVTVQRGTGLAVPAADIVINDLTVYPYDTIAHLEITGIYVKTNATAAGSALLFSNSFVDPSGVVGTTFDVIPSTSFTSGAWGVMAGTLIGTFPVNAGGTAVWGLRFNLPGTLYDYRVNLRLQRMAV
jgi:hypothetical protein